MKLIIAGSRHLNVGFDIINAVLYDNNLEPDEFVSGGATGVDRSGEEYATYSNTPLKIFRADWNTYGRAAGPIRNRLMAEYADGLVLIWDGKSRGSANMKSEMLRLNKPIYEIIIS